MTDKTLYFAYGSNLDLDGMDMRAPNAEPVCAADLHDWQLTFRGVADIEPAPGAIVRGALWWLDPQGVESIDRYEGAPNYYARQTVVVDVPGVLKTEAMTYVMLPNFQLEVGLPSPGYLATIAAGFRAFDLPMEELKQTLFRVEQEHKDQGVRMYRADGPKRMMAVQKVLADNMSPATRRLMELEGAA